MDTKTFQKLYVISVLLLLFFLVFTIIYVYKNKEMIQKNPMIYGINKAFPYGATNCICIHNWDDGKQEIYGFNNTHGWIGQKYYEGFSPKSEELGINISAN